MSIKKYIKVYKHFLATNIAVETSFRFNFFLVFLVEICWLLLLLSHNYILFEHIESFNGWNRDHFFFFSVLVALYDQLFLAFFATNFWRFSESLRLGTMDFVLTKPVSSLFSIFVRYQRISALFAALLSIVCAIYFGHNLNINFTFSTLIGLILLFIIGMTLRVGLEIIIGTFMFITIEGEAINILRLNLQQFAKQPAFIYRNTTRFILLYIFPLCMTTTLPATWLFSNGATPLIQIVLIMSAATTLIWALVFIVWRWGINRYESASS